MKEDMIQLHDANMYGPVFFYIYIFVLLHYN